MNIPRTFLTMLLLGAVLAPAALAQDTERPAQKPDPKTRYARVKYDATKEVTIVGTLEEIQEFDCPVSAAMGSHFLVRTTDSAIVVHVAPVSFMKQNGIVFKKGDKLRIVGVRMLDGDGRDTLVARELSSNELLIYVRSPDGKPLW